ncbi:hypothetical protein GGF46_001041 [Coemansia sp. RSA 552]|nr:hypothetical protein GGF46_001041 [Coemansia sp. RSA 552]
MTRRRQAITEKVPTTPRKVVVYTDNLMTSNSARNTADEPAKELAQSLSDTLNSSLVISTSFRFDPELNTLEILDPHNPRNNVQIKGYTNYQISVKMFILPAAVDASNRPSPLYVRQMMTCLKKQLGSVPIDELFVSFSGASAPSSSRSNSSSNSSNGGSLASLRKQFPQASGRDPGHEGGSAGSAGGSHSGSAVDPAELATPHEGSSNGSNSGNSSAADDGDMSRYLKVWRMLNKLRAEGDAAKIGVCDMSKQQLEQLCEQSGVVPDMIQVQVDNRQFLLDNDDDSGVDGGQPAALDNELRVFAREHSISIRTHSDCDDMLPNSTFQELAADFKINERFPTTEVPREGHIIDLMRPRWVANYSIALKSRGLIANRGYIVMASSDSVLDPNRVSRHG